ncbi:S8 family serine peptidase [Phytohabitans flavus]|uniref:S8 family serine peptidase n=1 Tax=Phytohabitans flavus TaxID=1076124 RepID=UPI00362D31F2
MTTPSATRGGRLAVAAAVACLTAAGGAPASAAARAPDLPSASDKCVGPSPQVEQEPFWAQARMEPEQLWPLSRGRGVLVALLDTGAGRPPALRDALRPGLDAVTGQPANGDCRGRGTALAGIIAARPQTGASPVGMAPEATVLPIRVVDGKGNMSRQAIVAGIRAAVDADADVIVVGGGVPTDGADLRDAVAEAIDADALLVAAVAPSPATGNRRPGTRPRTRRRSRSVR